MNHFTKLVSALFLALTMLGSLGLATASAHAYSPTSPQRQMINPSPAADEVVVVVNFTDQRHLALHQSQVMGAVTKICAGTQTKAIFKSFTTGKRHIIEPGTCRNFIQNSGLVHVVAAK